MKKYPLPTAPKTRAILKALKSGHRLTPLNALHLCRVMSLSQRIGDLIELGWPIRKSWKKANGVIVREYRLG